MARQRLTDQQRLDWLRLIRSENVGPATFRQLINLYGGASNALEALPELSNRGGLGRKIKLYNLDQTRRDIDRVEQLGGQFVAWSEPEYPSLLAHIYGAPPLICVKGRLELLNEPKIAIVGARNASALGRKLTRQIAKELADNGIVVVSGLARGIDTAAHEASLEDGTIAVLAGGIDHIYPPENEALHNKIAGQGVLLSEMSPGYKIQTRDFPRRNRLISGMSQGVVIIEAAKRSGSLITARFAQEQNREVFAVPGSPLDPRTIGTNNLIKQGAHIATGAQDVLDVVLPMMTKSSDMPGPPGLFSEELDENAPSTTLPAPQDLTDTARARLFEALGPSPVGIDDLVRECALEASQVHMLLVELDLANRITRHPSHEVSLNN